MKSKSSKQDVSKTDDHVDLIDLLYTILGEKKIISAITIIVVGVAALYAFLSQPIYQSNTLIQVENNNGSNGAALSQLNALFDIQSPATAEMEILRSRLVIGDAVDELKLYISAQPNYLPLIGRWLARNAKSLSTPGILGIGGYVTGNESIKVRTLDVPQELEGASLVLKATPHGFELLNTDETLLASGPLGTLVTFENENLQGQIIIDELNAKPGAEFILARASRLKTINRLQDQLNITEKGKQSGIIQASLEGSNPKLTAEILNAIGTAYVQQNIRRKAAEAEKSLAFLNNFLPELKKQMEESEARYTRFRDEHGTFNLGAEGTLSLEASAQLQTKLLELQQKRRELAPRFQSNHPAIKTIDDQISAIKVEQTKIDKDISRMPDIEQQMLGLMRNVQVNSEMYVNLLNGAQQLRLVKEGKVGNVRVIDGAPIPELPIKPKKLLILSVALIIGLLLGIATALVRAWIRPGIQDTSDIESTLGLHVFATIPMSTVQSALDIKLKAKAPGQHVLAQVSPQDPAVESLRGLRTALQFAMLNARNNILLITGPTPEIGKSFTSVNFSAVMGAASSRILLIDTDMRKGHMNQYFGLNRKQGLSELISGKYSFNDVIHKNVMPNVDFVSTGVVPPNPSELLLSTRMHDILNEVSGQYDFVVLDSGPVLAVSDALSLARQASTVFVVARAHTTTLGELDETVKRIRQAGADVKGILFNGVSQHNRRYGSKYSNYRYTAYNYSS